MTPRNMIIVGVTCVVSTLCMFKVERNHYAALVAENMQVVHAYYIEDVENRALYENAMDGMVARLDRFSGYVNPEEFQKMNASLDQEFGGVGVEVEKLEADSPLLVNNVVLESPARRAGLRRGDRIFRVDGVSLIGIDSSDCVRLMRGAPGSEVVLEIERPGVANHFQVRVTRELINTESVTGDWRDADGRWEFHLEEDPRVAYCRIRSFGKRTVEELTQVLGPGHPGPPFQAIVLDLRGNAGGLLDAAWQTCDLFVDKGRLVSTNGRNGALRESFEATGKLLIPQAIPMAVLVDGDSASASEIVAACLQDHQRAIVVGQRTYGKGTVQNLLTIEGGRSAIRLTVATYWRPSGKNIHRANDAQESDEWGVTPDEGYVVPQTLEEIQRTWERRNERERPRDAPDASRANDSDPAESSSGTPDDLPLLRAVEYLREWLDNP